MHFGATCLLRLGRKPFELLQKLMPMAMVHRLGDQHLQAMSRSLRLSSGGVGATASDRPYRDLHCFPVARLVWKMHLDRRRFMTLQDTK